MKRLPWRLTDLLSRSLDPSEREAVCGDLAESGENGLQALRDVLGLVLRRQADYWKHPRPWCVLIALVIPLGALLTFVSGRVADLTSLYAWLYLNNWTPRYFAAGFRNATALDGVSVLALLLLLACWSWNSGFAIASLTRRAVPSIGALLFLLLLTGEWISLPRFSLGGALTARGLSPNHAVFSLVFYHILFPLIVQLAFVVAPALCGMRSGIQLAAFSRSLASVVWISVIVTVAALFLGILSRWMHLHSTMFLLPLCAAGPVVFTLTAAARRRSV